MSEAVFDQKKYDELFETAHALAVTHNLLNQGIFAGAACKELSIALPFVEKMHKAVMVDLEPLMALKDAIATEVPTEAKAE